MEFEPWWLLVLPLLFVAGWFARGADRRIQSRDEAAAPRSMFRGLNLLLNEKPDQAIDAFIEVVRLDPETIELHYALGSLFRRRGEIERAVRIHNYLLNRADLPARERSSALAELAQDYLKGGLLDRAEDAFGRLVGERQHRFAALRALLSIYEMEGEWAKAIDTAGTLVGEAGETHAKSIAHFHCELAERAIAAGQADVARQELERALATDRHSVRALALRGDLQKRQGDRDAAIASWEAVEREAPQYLSLVADRLAAALDDAGRRDEALAMLMRNLREQPSIDALDLAFQRTLAWRGAQEAEALLRDELPRKPSLLGFERLLELRSAAANGDPELESLRALIRTQVRKLARYRCGHCGFRARDFHWQCPGCKNWDSYPPRRIEEVEG
ncbi:MAG TPA: lipopolysaccharide assembly protein LapB [Burkholderiaceae bacterium]|nr:lipopolysaccharide assembly protein LapB [Burkholderiaceae bacterium]